MFNRVILFYSSDAPMKGTAEYSVNSRTVRDVFWLEKAENGVFSLLIRDALTGNTAEDFRLLSLCSADGREGSGKIHEIRTDLAELPEESWIEKNGIRLGITLEMGGAIASLCDSGAPEGYTNSFSERTVSFLQFGSTSTFSKPWASNAAFMVFVST